MSDPIKPGEQEPENEASSSAAAITNSSRTLEATNQPEVNDETHVSEAVDDGQVSLPKRFFCHMCMMLITPNTDFTCPHCGGSFVEELRNFSVSSGPSSNSSSSNETELNGLRGEIENLLLLRNVPRIVVIRHANRPNNINHTDDVSEGADDGYNVSRTLGHGSLDGLLLDFLQSLSGGVIRPGLGRPILFFRSGADGFGDIDTLVTRLLDEVQDSGPPPLPKEKIAEIPIVQVTDEDVKAKSECSICWEDFRIGESVRKLPCDHIFHESCIVPWLSLHRTCPICRKNLSDEEELNGTTFDNVSGARDNLLASASNAMPNRDENTSAAPNTNDETQSESNAHSNIGNQK